MVDDDAHDVKAGPARSHSTAKGCATNRKNLVEKGELKTYLLDSYSARKLKLAPTGNASRSVGSLPALAPRTSTWCPAAKPPRRSSVRSSKVCISPS